MLEIEEYNEKQDIIKLARDILKKNKSLHSINQIGFDSGQWFAFLFFKED